MYKIKKIIVYKEKMISNVFVFGKKFTKKEKKI